MQNSTHPTSLSQEALSELRITLQYLGVENFHRYWALQTYLLSTIQRSNVAYCDHRDQPITGNDTIDKGLGVDWNQRRHDRWSFLNLRDHVRKKTNAGLTNDNLIPIS